MPALLSSPLFIPHKLSLLFHHLQEVSPDFRPAWATTFKPSSSWVGTKAVIRASALGKEMLGKLHWVDGWGQSSWAHLVI